MVGAGITFHWSSQRNRNHPLAVSGTSRWDTDKVVALILRSHTAVLADSVEALGSVAWKKACSVPVERECRGGLCASCLEPLDPIEDGKRHVGFCSEHCRKQAEKIRYVRQAIRDGRSTDPLTALVISSNMITFLAFDLAYTRSRLSNELRQEVLTQNDDRRVSCNKQPATEVDHIDGGSIELSNLRGLCRRCHVLKARGEIPDDLTRDGTGTIDTSEQSQELRQLWRLVLRSRQPLDEALEWRDLRERAAEYAGTRFGWVTQQILCDEPVCPAHDGIHWRTEWPRYRREYREWAKERAAVK